MNTFLVCSWHRNAHGKQDSERLQDREYASDKHEDDHPERQGHQVVKALEGFLSLFKPPLKGKA